MSGKDSGEGALTGCRGVTERRGNEEEELERQWARHACALLYVESVWYEAAGNLGSLGRVWMEADCCMGQGEIMDRSEEDCANGIPQSE